MTVRLDATEKLVIHCTEHVRDGQLVDPAVPSRLLRRSSESRHGRGLDVRGQRQSTCRTTQVPRTRCAKRQQHGIHPVVICPAIRARAACALRTSCGCTTTAVLRRGRRPSACSRKYSNLDRHCLARPSLNLANAQFYIHLYLMPSTEADPSEFRTGDQLTARILELMRIIIIK